MPASASSANSTACSPAIRPSSARTRDQIRKRADLSAATHLKIADVQQAIAGLEPVVRAQHGQIQGEVRLMQGVMIGLILLIALLIDTLQRKLARTLTNLAPALSTWAEGDFSRDIQLGKTNRELHDIEASLNRLRAYLVDLVGTIRRNAEQVGRQQPHPGRPEQRPA